MTSTIQLSQETKRLIGTFGSKEDTYEDIIKRLYIDNSVGCMTKFI